MMKQTTIILIIALIAIAVGVYFFLNKKTKKIEPPTADVQDQADAQDQKDYLKPGEIGPKTKEQTNEENQFSLFLNT